MRCVAAVAAVAALGAVAGCSLVNDPGRHQGGEAGDGGSGLDPIAERDYCAELAELGCTARDNCCDEPAAEGCVENIRDVCERELAPLFTDDRTGYDPMWAAEVIARGYDLQEGCSIDIAQWYVFDVLSVMRGSSQRGVNCAPPGTTTFPEDPAALWQCDADEELVCRPDSSGGVACQGRSSEGGPCNIIYHCERGLYCTSFFAGSCAPQKDVGEVCTDGSQCESLHCNESTGQCDRLDESIYCIPVEDYYGQGTGG